ncbi:MAG: MBL fold metallo-hydrolase, partial [Gammaproteobacteria bacterium]|nr:MBL fold metallo-hydrolase [Gammaproteobacteria bacterium]
FEQRHQQAGVSKVVVLLGLVIVVVAGYLSVGGKNIKKAATLASMEVIGNIAMRSMPDDAAGGFHRIPIEVTELADGIYQATGIANTHMITTSEGNVLFDTGIAIQTAKQLRLLKEESDAPVTHIILSHSHADHIGGTRYWKEEGTEVITHREFVEEQRYLKSLENYQWQRNRVLFPWMPETPSSNALLAYGGVEPSILVDERDYRFTQGGIEFIVLSTPGAEGADNICLWLPQKKILFTGDTLGPLFPQFPNVFTMRGEKIRKPMEYIHSLNKLIALEPEMIVPSHHTPINGGDNIKAALTRMRDAVQYVHDETIKGMNAGKSVYDLMKEIKLPPELALTEEHGKVSWAVKSIWEYYMGWFHFDSTTELYPVPAREVYAEVAAFAGSENLLAAAQNHFQEQQPEKSLHFLEMILAADPDHRAALETRLEILQFMLERAIGDDGGNNYEKDYLRSRIAITEQALVSAE